MYRAVNDLTLDGLQYRPGQVVPLDAHPPRLTQQLLEQRRVIYAVESAESAEPATPSESPRRKSA